MLEDDRPNRPSWLTPGTMMAHSNDALAHDLPEHQMGRGALNHAHEIRDSWPPEKKQVAGEHIDRCHGGTLIAPYK